MSDAADPRAGAGSYVAADGPLEGSTLQAPGGTVWCFQRPGRIEVVAAKAGSSIDRIQYDKVPDLLGHYAVERAGSATVLRWHPRPPRT